MGITEQDAAKAKEVLTRVRGILERKIASFEFVEGRDRTEFLFRRLRKNGMKCTFIVEAIFIPRGDRYMGVRIVFPNIRKIKKEKERADEAINHLNQAMFGPTLFRNSKYASARIDFPGDYVDADAFEENIATHLKDLKHRQGVLHREMIPAGQTPGLDFLSMLALMSAMADKADNKNAK